MLTDDLKYLDFADYAALECSPGLEDSSVHVDLVGRQIQQR